MMMGVIAKLLTTGTVYQENRNKFRLFSLYILRSSSNLRIGSQEHEVTGGGGDQEHGSITIRIHVI